MILAILDYISAMFRVLQNNSVVITVTLLVIYIK